MHKVMCVRKYALFSSSWFHCLCADTQWYKHKTYILSFFINQSKNNFLTHMILCITKCYQITAVSYFYSGHDLYSYGVKLASLYLFQFYYVTHSLFTQHSIGRLELDKCFFLILSKTCLDTEIMPHADCIGYKIQQSLPSQPRLDQS